MLLTCFNHIYLNVSACLVASWLILDAEAARKMDAPIMIQFSAGGAQFYAGKGLDTWRPPWRVARLLVPQAVPERYPLVMTNIAMENHHF